MKMKQQQQKFEEGKNSQEEFSKCKQSFNDFILSFFFFSLVTLLAFTLLLYGMPLGGHSEKNGIFGSFLCNMEWHFDSNKWTKIKYKFDKLKLLVFVAFGV